MNIYDSGYVYENTHNEYIAKADREVFLSTFLSLGRDTLTDYFKGNTIIPVFRLFMLHENETIDYEISRDVVSANLSVSYQSGQRRTLEITLCNGHNNWRYGARKTLYPGMKIRLDCGAVIDGAVYWQRQGVYMLKECTFSDDSSNKTVSVSCCDKWGIWDGSVYGNTEYKTVIPTQVPMRQVFDTIVHEDNGLGDMWDEMPVRFNTDYLNTLTFYTIKQDAGQTKANNLLDMAKTISSDVFYDNLGCMNVENSTIEFLNGNFPVVWRFDENGMDCAQPQLQFNRSEYYNKIITKGAIVNGYQFTGTAENKNVRSVYNTYDTPVSPKVNDNAKLYSDNLCLEQSMYEMFSQSRGLRNVTMTTAYLPFLDVNMAVVLDFPSIGIERAVYLTDSISYNISAECTMSLGLTSDYEVVV